MKVIKDYGVPDLVVHSAGCFYIQRFCDKDYDSWERMVSLNIMGALTLLGELINPMKVDNENDVTHDDNENESRPEARE